jgi:hypothetical protein
MGHKPSQLSVSYHHYCMISLLHYIIDTLCVLTTKGSSKTVEIWNCWGIQAFRLGITQSSRSMDWGPRLFLNNLSMGPKLGEEGGKPDKAII